MFQVHDNFTLNVKRNSKAIKDMLVLFGGVCAAMSVFYGLYWGLALNDGIIVEYAQQYLSPLVSIFFDDINLLDNYLTMGFYLLLTSAVCAVIHYFTEKAEETIISVHQKISDTKKRLEKIRTEKEREKEYTIIDGFSVCISMDLSKNTQLASSFSEKLNTYFAKSLKKELNKISKSTQITNSRAILVYSKDFYMYDKIYSIILKELANVKNLLGANIIFTPTITTDAHMGEFIPEKAIKQHFDIVKCNLQGRSTTTAAFSKKYTHLSQSKFAGTPIGLYTTTENKNYNEYDLNVVHKNLNNTLSSLV